MKNETAGVLQIENTTALDIMSHSVECILKNVIPEEFLGDCDLLPRGSCDDVTKSATLEIRGPNGPTPPTVTSSESDIETHADHRGILSLQQPHHCLVIFSPAGRPLGLQSTG